MNNSLLGKGERNSDESDFIPHVQELIASKRTKTRFMVEMIFRLKL